MTRAPAFKHEVAVLQLLAEKLAPGVVLETGTGLIKQAADEQERARLTKKRDDARWFVIVGVGLMFASGVSVAFGAGGAAMCVYGVAMSIVWGRKLAAFEDPWDDPEMDAWEEEHFGAP